MARVSMSAFGGSKGSALYGRLESNLAMCRNAPCLSTRRRNMSNDSTYHHNMSKKVRFFDILNKVAHSNAVVSRQVSPDISPGHPEERGMSDEQWGMRNG
jgi:hypothetical protein